MKFSGWTLDALINYLKSLHSAPQERLDYHCVTRCSGEIFVYNGERADGDIDFDIFDLAKGGDE